ncbi:hypothetical protein QCA50_004346 [Cerrena zonata]|uniref:Uncharacterized protein n=1 Tax=Cerrena zonata TaxID=2478898 RepID=A0AAW0GGJ4_9APHY
MSYASVAAHNAPPRSEQPQPDFGLLNTEPPTADNIADDAAKLNIVSPDWKSNPATITSETRPPPASDKEKIPAKAKARARRYAHEAEVEGFHLWNVTQNYLFRPAVAGGLLGLLNVGILGGVGYAAYTRPELRQDTKFLASTTAGILALFGAEGYATERYLETPAGKAEEKRAKEEGAALYRVAREQILRPGVLGGLVGALNAGILGTLGYFAYLHWDAPRWDRRTVSVISVGLFTLWTGEGYIAEQYRLKQH